MPDLQGSRRNAHFCNSMKQKDKEDKEHNKVNIGVFDTTKNMCFPNQSEIQRLTQKYPSLVVNIQLGIEHVPKNYLWMLGRNKYNNKYRLKVNIDDSLSST